MRHPLWILNSALFFLFIIILGFILVSRVEVPPREDIEPTGFTKPIAKKFSEINIRKIYEHDLFDTYITTIEEPKEPNYVAPLPQPPMPKPVHVPPEPKPQFLPPLKITLKGIFVIADDDTKNRAVIADSQTKKETTYKVGDVIEDAQLIKIFSNKVLFLRANGQQEVLYLRPKDAQLDPVYANINGWKDAIQKITDTTYTIDTQEFTFRIKNLAQFIDLLDLTTVYQQGKSVGCRIGTLSENSFGAELGLQSGDIILAINGITTADTAHRMEIYKQIRSLKSKDTIIVELLRNNIPLKYTLLLRVKEEEKTREGVAKPTVSKNQIKLMEERHTFTPTLREIRAQERKNMLQHGQAPKKSLTTPTHE